MTTAFSTSYSAGDVVRVAFVFTAQTQTKLRPAIVLSSAGFHISRSDMILMPLSTKAGGYYGDRPLIDWLGAGLPLPTSIKAVIQTIPQTSVVGRLGRLGSQDIQLVKDALGDIIGLP